MKSFRMSIATLGICVMLFAFDLAVLRYSPRNDRTLLDLFALPMLNILAFSSYRGRVGRRLGAPRPFLRGFQAFGWAALIAYLAWCRIDLLGVGRALALATEPVHWLTLDHLSFDTMQRLDPTFTLAWKISKAVQEVAAASLVTIVMLLPATLGGMIASRQHRQQLGGR